MQGNVARHPAPRCRFKCLRQRRDFSLDGAGHGVDDAVHIPGFGVYLALGHKACALLTYSSFTIRASHHVM